MALRSICFGSSEQIYTPGFTIHKTPERKRKISKRRDGNDDRDPLTQKKLSDSGSPQRKVGDTGMFSDLTPPNRSHTLISTPDYYSGVLSGPILLVSQTRSYLTKSRLNMYYFWSVQSR